MTNKQPRGHCPICNTSHRLTKAGKVWNHGAKDGSWPPMNCRGSGHDPVPPSPPGNREAEDQHQRDESVSG